MLLDLSDSFGSIVGNKQKKDLEEVKVHDINLISYNINDCYHFLDRKKLQIISSVFLDIVKRKKKQNKNYEENFFLVWLSEVHLKPFTRVWSVFIKYASKT